MKRKLPVFTAITLLFVTTVIAAYAQTAVAPRRFGSRRPQFVDDDEANDQRPPGRPGIQPAVLDYTQTAKVTITGRRR
jgi:hypothetical protein